MNMPPGQGSSVWGEFGHLGAAHGVSQGEFGVLGAAAGQAQGARGAEAAASGRKCFSEVSKEQQRQWGLRGKEFGVQGAKYGRMGGRPQKQRDPDEPDLPDAVSRVLHPENHRGVARLGHKLKAAQFIQGKLLEAGYQEQEGSAPTLQQWAIVRDHFGKGVKTRQLQRIYDQRATVQKGIEKLRLGRSGGLYSRRKSKQGLGGQAGRGVRLIERHLQENNPDAKGPGKRSLLLPIYRKVYQQFLQWRKAGQYVDLTDLFLEYCLQALTPQEERF